MLRNWLLGVTEVLDLIELMVSTQHLLKLLGFLDTSGNADADDAAYDMAF